MVGIGKCYPIVLLLMCCVVSIPLPSVDTSSVSREKVGMNLYAMPW